jgi:hypothetical protein
LGEVEDGFDLKAGPNVFVDAGGIVAISLSVCSQLYVNTFSASKSVPTPLKIKGVDFGIEKSAPALEVGVALPLSIETAQFAEL